MNTKKTITINEMLDKLDGLYDKEEALLKELEMVGLELEQLRQDKELLQTIIMHQSNTKNRGKKNE